MEKFSKKLITKVKTQKKDLKLFSKEKKYGLLKIYTSSYSEELNILARGEDDKPNSKFRNALITFFCLNTREIIGIF